MPEHQHLPNEHYLLIHSNIDPQFWAIQHRHEYEVQDVHSKIQVFLWDRSHIHNPKWWQKPMAINKLTTISSFSYFMPILKNEKIVVSILIFMLYTKVHVWKCHCTQKKIALRFSDLFSLQSEWQNWSLWTYRGVFLWRLGWGCCYCNKGWWV